MHYLRPVFSDYLCTLIYQTDCKMKRYHTIIGILAFLFSLSGCDTIEYHPYDARIEGATNINRCNIGRIEERLAGVDSFRFAFISDTQRWYDETEKVVKAINQRSDIDFVVHGGDLSDFGATKELLWQRDILNRLKMPYVCLLGNHDCLGTGEEVFRKVFGEPNFAFTAGNVRFVCLNTNAMEFDYSEPVPDFRFLKQERDSFPTEASRTLFAMHVKPMDEQFNNNVADIFQEYISRFPDPICCIYGHGHKLMTSDLFGDGLLYHQVSNIQKRKYLLFTIYPEGYSYETIDF